MKIIYDTTTGLVKQVVNEKQNFDRIFQGYTGVSWIESDFEPPKFGSWWVNTDTQEIETNLP